MEKCIATKVNKNDDVVLANNTFLRKALFAIIRDSRGVDEIASNVIDWEEILMEARESIDIRHEFIIKFTPEILYRIDIDE